MSEQNTTTESVALSDLTLDQLVQLSQGLGRKVDALREQRAHVKRLIDASLAAGERNGQASGGDASAPGALIDVKAN